MRLLTAVLGLLGLERRKPTHEVLQLHVSGADGKGFHVAQQQFPLSAPAGEKLAWLDEVLGRCIAATGDETMRVKVVRRGQPEFIYGLRGDTGPALFREAGRP